MAPTEIPTELWLKIIEESIHVPHLMDIHPATSSPFAIAPNDFSLIRLHSSLRARASFARVSKWFNSLISSFPCDCLLVTKRNACILHHALLAWDSLALQIPRKTRPRHPLFMSIRHLIVEIDPEQRCSNKYLLNKALKSIIYHIPNVQIFTMNFVPSISILPDDMSSILRVLSFVCAQKLEKIAFRGGSCALFHPFRIGSLVAHSSSQSLQTFAISAPPSLHPQLVERHKEYVIRFQYSMWPPNLSIKDPAKFSILDSDPESTLPCLKPRRLGVSVNDDTLPGLRDLLDHHNGKETSLTHLSVKLLTSSPKDVVLFEIDPDTHPRLTHLALHGVVDQLLDVLKDGTRPFPAVKNLALSILDGATCTPANMLALIERVVALSGSALASVRFLDEDFVQCLRQLQGRDADGTGLRAVVARLFTCTFVTEDCEGESLLDVFD